MSDVLQGMAQMRAALSVLLGVALVGCGNSSGQNQVGSDGGPDGMGAIVSANGGGSSAGPSGGNGGSSGESGGESFGSGGESSGGGGTGGGGAAGGGGGGGGAAGAGGTGPVLDAGLTSGWLRTIGNKIVTPDGTPFHGRGANLHDTRSCNACAYAPPDPAGLNAWADELIDHWHANFIRFDLEAYASADGRTQWKSLVEDDGYYADIQTVVNHMTSKPGVYVMVTLFMDPTEVPDGQTHAEWPTEATLPAYSRLAEAFYDNPRVLFSLMNEPHDPASENAAIAQIFTKCVQRIRDVETAHGAPQHIVVVQATQDYARDLSYWVAHPLRVAGGTNIAYETHPYNHPADFDKLFVQPAKQIPVIIGEFGPATIGNTEYMNEDDARALMETAEANEIPYIAWNFHQRCPPNLLEDVGGDGYDGCGFAGAGTVFKWLPTEWGTLLKDRLATPY